MERYNAASGRAASQSAGEAFKDYLDSLSADQLVTAGRQASDEIMQDYRRHEWPRVSLSLGWFYQEYPKKTGNLADIEPLLQEMSNPQRPAYWRWFLEDLLTGSWEREGRLTNQQRRKVTETLLSVLQGKDEPTAVVAGAAKGIPRMLAALKEDLPRGDEGQEHREALRTLTAFSGRYLKTAAGIVSEPDADPLVLRETLGGLVGVAELGVANTRTAVAAVREAAESYASYPEELWPRLMLTAVKLGAEADFEKLLAAASDGAEQQDTGERLQAVRSLLGKTQVAAIQKEDEERRTKAPSVRRLSECSRGELLAMARHRADLLAHGTAGEGAWSELSAILREYDGRAEAE